ncbi:MAG: hypothetical protein IJC94_05035 [Oscillospiraceae bacterium]|nr:hypothetical protein [Oscillospiraceae bacterium]
MVFNITYGGKPRSDFAIPVFSGSHAVFGNESCGYMECYSSGTLTFSKPGKIDVFILGSGLAGAKSSALNESVQGGKGGSGAVGLTLYQFDVEETSYTITVAAACSSTSRSNKSSAFDTSTQYNSITANGGTGGRLYANTVYNTATNGKDGTSYPFDETEGVFFKQFGAGGGGGEASIYWNGYTVTTAGKGGTLGGGNGGIDAAANTGSGGGGAAAYNTSSNSGATETTYVDGARGGSGIVIVRWGY